MFKDLQPKLSNIAWETNPQLTASLFRYSEMHQNHVIQTKLYNLSPLLWGFESLQWDAEKLAKGIASIQETQGIFQDGSLFSIHEKKIHATNDHAVNDYSSCISNHLNLTEGIHTGTLLLLVKSKTVPIQAPNKEFDKCQPAAIKLQTYTLTNTPPYLSPESIYLPIAKVKYVKANGELELDESFIPPCLFLHSHLNYQKKMKQYLKIIEDQITYLANNIHNHSKEIEISLNQKAQRLQTLNRHKGGLFLLLNQPNHPLKLYEWMCQLICELSVNSKQGPIEPEILPEYNHLDAGKVFDSLTDLLQNYF